MTMKKMVDGVEADMTPDEEAAFIASIEPVQTVPESVSSRQFKLQLLAAGLLDQVNGWIATQSRAVQIAYEYSGSFVRTAPMMTEGFQAMGFTDQQIDDFFTAAAKL
jgi:hypothetical protein